MLRTLTAQIAALTPSIGDRSTAMLSCDIVTIPPRSAMVRAARPVAEIGDACGRFT